MLKKSLLIAVVLSTSSLFAQMLTIPPARMVAGPIVSQDQMEEVSPDTTACSFGYASGTGLNATAYCLSVNGNIVQFSRPAGFEYIKAGTIGEGYGICDLTAGGVPYFDYAAFEFGNWGATVATFPNATTAKFVRSTSDGIWTLTQTIKQVKANASGPGSAKVTMAIKNNTAINRDIFVMRYADVDAGGTVGNDTVNQSQDAAFANDNFFNGLSLTNNTYTFFDHLAAVYIGANGPNPCNFNVNRLVSPAAAIGIDGAIAHIYAFVVPKGATKTVTLTYKPY